MKHLSLQQAMLGMRVIQTDTGTIIKSPAGSAVYDLKGRRLKVNGYPEYFPDHLRVKDKRKPKHGSALINHDGITCRSADGTVRVHIGHFEKPKARPDCTPEEIRDAIERIHAGRQEKADKKLVVETCLNEALIQPGSIQASHIYAGHNFKPSSDERRMDAVAKAPEKVFGALASNYIFNPETATKTRLTDDMREAVLDAVRESDLFQSLQAELHGQTDSVDNLQQTMQQAATDAIRNALKPGGLLFGKR